MKLLGSLTALGKSAGGIVGQSNPIKLLGGSDSSDEEFHAGSPKR